MFIFIYTLVILFLGLLNKLTQSLAGAYGLDAFIRDLPLIFFTYFGLIALWGRAKSAPVFSEGFWRAYLAILLLSVVLIPWIDTNVKAVTEQLGTVRGLLAYGVTVLIMLPYFWGLYSYTFGSNRPWLSAATNQSDSKS